MSSILWINVEIDAAKYLWNWNEIQPTITKLLQLFLLCVCGAHSISIWFSFGFFYFSFLINANKCAWIRVCALLSGQKQIHFQRKIPRGLHSPHRINSLTFSAQLDKNVELLRTKTYGIWNYRISVLFSLFFSRHLEPATAAIWSLHAYSRHILLIM